MADFDLNLVRVFVLLYETRSVTATAEAVHVSQPTVSYGLAKLRRRFDDELFRRGRGGLEPTVVADRLYEPLRDALAGISAAVDPGSAFDPAVASARFTIALSDLGESSLLPRLVGPLQAEAPSVSLTVRPLDLVLSPEQLVRGQLDAFVATPTMSSPQLRRIPLFAEGYVAMVGAGHPRLPRDEVSVEELRAERHVLVDSRTGHVGPKLALETLELLDRVALQVSKFSVLPYLVTGSDLVAVVPSFVGHVFTTSHPVRLLALPIPLEPLEIALYARPEASRTPAQRWLVDFLHRHLTR
ncbi:LysR family transcriptional regulator [Modestobacter sp. NPDC049651]|uniref:LysR family transcriptional regulator n=1 Tax=unclassified Modestobacter TaxID=2643866 RepID=UPI0033C67AB1